MNDSKISVRYAKALFSLGLEENKLTEFKQDADLLFGLFTTGEFKQFLESPIIKTSEKQAIFATVFKDKVQNTFYAFLKLVVKNKREIYLQSIARNFLQLYRKHLGIKSAQITTAIPLDLQIKESVEKMIQTKFNAKVELTQKVKEDILGGYILKIDDSQIDASVATKLKKIKRELLETTLDR